jgi:hypothetical protein
VLIDGREFATEWDGATAVAVDQVKIVWGRKSRYEEVPPASLALTLLDPAGWCFEQPLQGLPIEVRATGGFLFELLFVGRIQNAVPTDVTVTNPVTGQKQHVWRVAITAKDPLADLATAKVRGPSADGSWPMESLDQRIAHILDLIRSDQITGVTTVGAGTLTVSGHAADDTTNPLELLRLALAAAGLDKLQYHAGGYREINRAYEQPSSGLALGWNGITLSLSPVSGYDTTFPASKIKLPGALSFASTLADAIDVVQLTTQTATPGESETQEAHTSRYDASRQGVRTLTVKSDAVSTGGSSSLDLFPSLLERVEAINGGWTHPTIRYDFSTEFTDRVPPSFGTTWQERESVYFPGSRWVAVPGPGTYQVIGGTLVCDGKKWVHDMNLAATIGTPDTVTLAELVTNPDPTFADFDPSVTLADLGRVTQGA